MPAKNFHVRQAAVSALRAWAKGHDYAETLIDRHAHRRMLSSQDRGLLQAILFGALRHRRLLDYWIGKLRDGKVDPETRDVLRVGLVQLLILGLPDHAAVNETVEAGKASVRSLINAVLRRATLSRKRLLDLEDVPLPVVHSHPDWLYNRWRQQYGKANTIALMEWNNKPSENYFRLNPLAPGYDELLAAGSAPAAAFTDNEENDDADEDGFQSLDSFELPGSETPVKEAPPAESSKPLLPGKPVPNAPGFYHLKGNIPTALLAKGQVYIQDPATRHSVDLLAPQPGERILDACAAPGGKAFLIAAALGSAENLVCTDSNEKRLPRLLENLARLHAGNAETAVHDWTKPAPDKWHNSFDAILLDVPCSNTGVIRRRVDVRWRLQAPDIEKLVLTQRKILEAALPCLKPGGRLVYSTCAIEHAENQGQIEAFLADHPELELVETRVALPFRDKTDGAFAALIVRKK
jgi:16S rRNA (cytosine967-C5)-methyltransferase